MSSQRFKMWIFMTFSLHIETLNSYLFICLIMKNPSLARFLFLGLQANTHSYSSLIRQSEDL